MADLEQRLTSLEETSFFQEQRLKELDAALTAQQSQLDTLEKELADALAVIRLLADADMKCSQAELADALAVIRLLREKLAEQPDNSLPPHFMPERY